MPADTRRSQRLGRPSLAGTIPAVEEAGRDASGRRERLTEIDLATRSSRDPERIRRFVEAGVLRPGPDGRFDPGDLHPVRLISAFEDAGVPLQALAAAEQGGRISFAYYAELHHPSGEPSGRPYGAFRDALGPSAAHLPALFAAFGLAQPDASSELTREDEALISEILEIVVGTHQVDLGLRAVRGYGDGLRRAAEGALGAYGEAVAREGEALASLRPDETFDLKVRPWARLARASNRLATWLAEQHLRDAIDAFSVATTEELLEAAGYVQPRMDEPPAVAFVDLTGFTRLTEEQGDEAAARVALRLGEVASEIAARSDGRLVKLLGDGVLLRFDGPRPAVEATLDLLGRLVDADLPSGHAGVAAGPLIARDGDVFGRTVNLAARIADAAPDGRLYVPDAVARGLPATEFRAVEAGTALLQGLGHLPLFEVSRQGR